MHGQMQHGLGLLKGYAHVTHEGELPRFFENQEKRIGLLHMQTLEQE